MPGSGPPRAGPRGARGAPSRPALALAGFLVLASAGAAQAGAVHGPLALIDCDDGSGGLGCSIGACRMDLEAPGLDCPGPALAPRALLDCETNAGGVTCSLDCDLPDDLAACLP